MELQGVQEPIVSAGVARIGKPIIAPGVVRIQEPIAPDIHPPAWIVGDIARRKNDGDRIPVDRRLVDRQSICVLGGLSSPVDLCMGWLIFTSRSVYWAVVLHQSIIEWNGAADLHQLICVSGG